MKTKTKRPKNILTKGQLLKYLDEMALEYKRENIDVITWFTGVTIVELVDNLLVDFVNFIGKNQGINYGLKTSDLYEKLQDKLQIKSIPSNKNLKPCPALIRSSGSEFTVYFTVKDCQECPNRQP